MAQPTSTGFASNANPGGRTPIIDASEYEIPGSVLGEGVDWNADEEMRDEAAAYQAYQNVSSRSKESADESRVLQRRVSRCWLGSSSKLPTLRSIPLSKLNPR